MSRVQVAHLRMLTIELINGSFIFIVIAWNHPTYYPFKCANHQFTLHSNEKLPVCQPNKLSQKCSIMRCLWPLANGQLRWFYCFKLVYPPWNNPPKSTPENSNGWKTQTIFHLGFSIFIWFSGALGLVVSFQGKSVNKPWETNARTLEEFGTALYRGLETLQRLRHPEGRTDLPTSGPVLNFCFHVFFFFGVSVCGYVIYE